MNAIVISIALAMLFLPGCSPKRKSPSARGAPTRFETSRLARERPGAGPLPASRILFAPGDTVFACVLTHGGGGAAISVQWQEESGQPVDASSLSSPEGGGVSVFHTRPEHGWRKGRYLVDVLLDGSSMEQRSFEVR